MNRQHFIPTLLIITSSLALSACVQPKKQITEPPLSQSSSQTSKTITPENTSENWQNFTSPKYKFSFKYPPEWKLKKETESDQGLSLALLKSEEIIAVRVEKNPDNLSAREYELKRYLPSGREDVSKTLTDIEVNGVRGIWSMVPSTEGQATMLALAPMNGWIYGFGYTSDTGESEEFNKIVESISYN